MISLGPSLNDSKMMTSSNKLSVRYKTTVVEKDYESKTLSNWGSKIEEPAVSCRNASPKDLKLLWHRWLMEMMRNRKLIQYSMFPVIAICLSFIFCNSKFFPDGYGCEGTKNPGMCGLEKELSAEIGQIRTLMAFILGGFVAGTNTFWRLRRNNYAVLCGRARTLIIQFGALLPRTTNKEEDAESFNRRDTMLRWVVLGYELAVLKGRGQIDSIEGRDHLEFLGLLKDDEWDKLIEGDRHTTVWYWLQSKAADLRAEGVIEELRLMQFINITANMRDTANDLMSRLDRDHSIPYSAIVGSLINLNLWAYTAQKTVQWSIWTHGNAQIWLTPRMWFAVIFFICYTSLLAMLFDVSHTLYNPFGWRELDIPHNIIGGGIRNLAKKVALGENFPSTMKSGVGTGTIS